MKSFYDIFKLIVDCIRLVYETVKLVKEILRDNKKRPEL